MNLNAVYKEILENPGIEKIVHAPAEDLRIIRMQGYSPVSIFDTERSAKLLDFSQVNMNIGINHNHRKSWYRVASHALISPRIPFLDISGAGAEGHASGGCRQGPANIQLDSETAE